MAADRIGCNQSSETKAITIPASKIVKGAYELSQKLFQKKNQRNAHRRFVIYIRLPLGKPGRMQFNPAYHLHTQTTTISI